MIARSTKTLFPEGSSTKNHHKVMENKTANNYAPKDKPRNSLWLLFLFNMTSPHIRAFCKTLHYQDVNCVKQQKKRCGWLFLA
jgi:hypothetical protein